MIVLRKTCQGLGLHRSPAFYQKKSIQSLRASEVGRQKKCCSDPAEILLHLPSQHRCSRSLVDLDVVPSLIAIALDAQLKL